jgi:hypothetical protein
VCLELDLKYQIQNNSNTQDIERIVDELDATFRQLDGQLCEVLDPDQHERWVFFVRTLYSLIAEQTSIQFKVRYVTGQIKKLEEFSVCHSVVDVNIFHFSSSNCPPVDPPTQVPARTQKAIFNVNIGCDFILPSFSIVHSSNFCYTGIFAVYTLRDHVPNATQSNCTFRENKVGSKIWASQRIGAIHNCRPTLTRFKIEQFGRRR